MVTSSRKGEAALFLLQSFCTKTHGSQVQEMACWYLTLERHFRLNKVFCRPSLSQCGNPPQLCKFLSEKRAHIREETQEDLGLIKLRMTQKRLLLIKACE